MHMISLIMINIKKKKKPATISLNTFTVANDLFRKHQQS